MTALSFVWVHPYSQNSGCDIYFIKKEKKMQHKNCEKTF